jgi:hypothetical protein
VSRRNAFGANPYDLLCTLSGKEDRHVEVKGTTTAASKLILTRKEVAHARVRDSVSDIFIVAEIRIEEAAGRSIATGGESRLLQNWRLKKGL